MAKPVKHSIAVAIFNGNRILSIRRPEDDDELPGVWGLPAGTFKAGESAEDLIARIGRDKLGVTLTPVRRLRSASQDRPRYRLEMELCEAFMSGQPRHPEWAWVERHGLEAGARQGSLCCRMALDLQG